MLKILTLAMVIALAATIGTLAGRVTRAALDLDHVSAAIDTQSLPWKE
jgi:hypothetical protein